MIGTLEMGGAERQLVALARALARRGRSVAVFSLRGPGVFGPELAQAGVPVAGPPFAAVLGGGAKAARILLFGLALIRLLALMLARRPRIAHCFLPEAYLAGGYAALLAGRPVLAMSRRSLNHYQRRRPWAVALERRLFPRTAALLANSEAVAADLAAEGAPKERIGLIRNGVDLAAFDAELAPRGSARAALDLDGQALVMVCVANLIPYKGHADLLEALAIAAPRLPAGWMLICFGRDDGAGGELARRTAALGLDRRVRWLGFRRDARRLLAAADLGLLASHEEGFSNTLLEYMAAGLPVVATAVGGNPEAVEAERTGLLVPARDPAALAEAIAALAALPAHRAAMGRAGRERVAARFSLLACVERHERLYDGLLRGAAEPAARLIDPARPG